MTVALLFNTPLWVCSKAIRKCWASESKSDTTCSVTQGWGEADITDVNLFQVDIKDAEDIVTGEADKALILRVGNKNKHASTLEHLNYTFDIDGISRACLQELARHRHASLSVKSTRYTLKELKDAELGIEIVDGELYEHGKEVWNYIIPVDNYLVNRSNVVALKDLQDRLQEGISNDIVKYMLPEAYKTSLVWTVNARSLQNFLALRTNKAALWEIRELANAIFTSLPEEHRYLFEDFVNEKGE